MRKILLLCLCLPLAAQAHDDDHHGGVNYMDPNDFVQPYQPIEHHHHYYHGAQPPVVLTQPDAVNYIELGLLLGDLIFGDDE